MILTTSPKPTGGGPKPTFETYSGPSGPKVIAVGTNNPVGISSRVSSSRTRSTFRVNGVKGFPFVFLGCKCAHERRKLHPRPRSVQPTPS